MMGLSEKFVFCVMRNSPESLEISFFFGSWAGGGNVTSNDLPVWWRSLKQVHVDDWGFGSS